MSRFLRRAIVRPLTMVVVVLFAVTTPGLAHATGGGPASSHAACGPQDRGRLIGFERIASHPTPASARDYFDSWVDFYRDYYGFPADIDADISYGFDSFRVSYCTIDAHLPGRRWPAPTLATGNVSVPRKAGPLATVAYLHGTAVSFYDAPSNPNIFGEFSESGESFDGPVSSAVFAGAGYVYVAPDYLGLGGSTVPRHRYFHAATEATSALDLLAATAPVLDRLRIRRTDQLYTFGFSQGGHAALALHELWSDIAST